MLDALVDCTFEKCDMSSIYTRVVATFKKRIGRVFILPSVIKREHLFKKPLMPLETFQRISAAAAISLKGERQLF